MPDWKERGYISLMPDKEEADEKAALKVQNGGHSTGMNGNTLANGNGVRKLQR